MPFFSVVPSGSGTDCFVPESPLYDTVVQIGDFSISQNRKNRIFFLISVISEPSRRFSGKLLELSGKIFRCGESADFADLCGSQIAVFQQLQGILQAHVNENGVLSCLILRDAMPEDLY